MQAALGFATLLLAGLLLALAIAVWFTTHRLRNPPRRTYGSAMSRGLPGDPSELDTPRAFDEWTLTTDVQVAGRARTVAVPVWEVVGDDPQGPVGVLTPGWGDSRVGGLLRVPALAPHCSRLLLWDPPGQGEAPGRCYLGTVEDQIIAALLKRAADEHDADGKAILFGWSLGAGSSIVAATHNDVAPRVCAVIAEGLYRQPWTPARNVLHAAGYPHRANLPIAFVLLGLRLGVGPRWKSFDRASHAARVQAPLLALHGSRDEVCPVQDARAVAKAAPQGRLAVIENAGHNDMWTDARFSEQATRAINDLLRAALTAPSEAAAHG